jgi:uncharacterized membrane protein YgdD (TMEM256/DUF423 family)
MKTDQSVDKESKVQRTDKVWWLGVAFSGALMVLLGAYAAHGLETRASAELISAVETGVRYQAWHTLAMLAVLVWRSSCPVAGQHWVLALWSLGIAGFSGSLYLMALAGLSLGIVTPIGGLLLVAGWLVLGGVAIGADFSARPPHNPGG